MMRMPGRHAVIALSIAYVAAETFFIKQSRHRWQLALFFGLVHGFGFANALTELGLTGSTLAKALVGYMSTSDPRALDRLASENRRLRQRVADLEAHVMRLQVENDALAASLSSEELLTVPEHMQPV